MTNIFKLIKKFMFTNKNKKLEHELEHDELEQKTNYIIKKPSKEVIEIARRFKNENENDKNSYENDTLCSNVQVEDEKLYIQFENFIINNSVGSKRPTNKQIEEYLNLDSIRKRRDLIEYGVNKGFLLRKNDTTTIFNINYEKESKAI